MRSTRNNRNCNNGMAPRKLRMTWPIHDATWQWQRHLASTAQHHQQHQQEQCNVEQRRQSSAITEITSTSNNTNIRNFQQLVHSGHNRPSTPGPLLIRTAMVGRRVAHIGDLFLLLEGVGGGEPHQCTQHVGWSGGASGDLAVSRMQIHQHALPLRYRHNKYYTMEPAAAAASCNVPTFLLMMTQPCCCCCGCCCSK